MQFVFLVWAISAREAHAFEARSQSQKLFQFMFRILFPEIHITSTSGRSRIANGKRETEKREQHSLSIVCPAIQFHWCMSHINCLILNDTPFTIAIMQTQKLERIETIVPGILVGLVHSWQAVTLWLIIHLVMYTWLGKSTRQSNCVIQIQGPAGLTFSILPKETVQTVTKQPQGIQAQEKLSLDAEKAIKLALTFYKEVHWLQS